MEVIGTVVRLQVQRSPLKPGPRGARVYTTEPLLEVTALDVGPRGVIGHSSEGPVLDVHHADHPQSRNRKLVNGLSLLPRAHYDALRARYGPHLVDGVAGESLLLETEGVWTEADLQGRLEVETIDGDRLLLTSPMAADPCVEFGRFCLGRGLGPLDADVEQTLVDLGDGARGFYVQPQGTGVIAAGARLLRG